MGASIGQLSNLWGLIQPQRHYFMLAVPARSNADGRRQVSPSGGSTDRASCRRRNAKPALPATTLEKNPQGLCAICGVSFERLVAEPAYPAHWRADDDNPP
jgi:hypothetical protein